MNSSQQNTGAKQLGVFSAVMPALALLVSFSFVAFPAIESYGFLKRASPNSSMIMVGNGVYDFQVPADRLAHFVISSAAMQLVNPITLLNAPGFLVYSLGAGITGHSAHWSPSSVDPFIWRVIVIPLCAIPAWWFIGRGIDGLFRRRRLRMADRIVSVMLAVGALALSISLRFGLTPQERAGQDTLPWFIAGFAWWAVLFAIPFGAWLYHRFHAVQTA